MAATARALRTAGHDVISLTLCEPDFATASHLVAAVHRAALAGATPTIRVVSDSSKKAGGFTPWTPDRRAAGVEGAKPPAFLGWVGKGAMPLRHCTIQTFTFGS
jgi:hypothetical protein